MEEAARFAWPVRSAADAIEQLAIASGLPLRSSRLSRRQGPSTDSVDGGVERLTRALDFEAESGDVTYSDLETTLQTSGPALVRVRLDDNDYFLAIIGSTGRTIRLLLPDGKRRRVRTETVAAWIRHHLEVPLDESVNRLLTAANVSQERRRVARRALMATRLGAQVATRCWLLRPTPSASLWRHLRHAHLPRRLAVFLLAYAGAACASVGAWWVIGSAALGGRFDPGTLLAWSFLLLSLVPLGLFARWAQGVFVVGVSGVLKQRLLAGAMRLDPDETRHQGVGQHLARVLESESVEALTLAGGFYAVAGLFELLLAALALIAIGSYLQLVLLAASAAILAALSAAYFRNRERWTVARLALTHDLVERMVGHRTRLVQEFGVARHEEEDEALEGYVTLSKRMDRTSLFFSAIPRVWLLIGIGGLAREFVIAETSPERLAAGLGATLLAMGALSKVTASLSSLSDAAISWRQVSPLLAALQRAEPQGHVDVAPQGASDRRTARPSPLIAAQDLAYKFTDRTESVLRSCNFRINQGDRIHLTGPSGSGKSTLVSLLTALRPADSGLLLLDGLDRATLGVRGWRRRVAAAPQFQENHLFNDTLAFNLLMGRRWPPTAEDVRLAHTVCVRLGLGDLIGRMPGGLFQVVGETGWLLSHGERSRVYMARALLQGADLVVLDESFAELDPDSLQHCLPEAADLAKSLLVVAHA